MQDKEFEQFVAALMALIIDFKAKQGDVLRALSRIFNGRRSKTKPRKG